MNVLIVISYNGSKFDGYQIQPEHRTVQGELESVLKQLFNNPNFKSYSSGRTDAGVHAIKQYVNFYIDEEYDLDLLMYKFNRILPSDIRVLSIKKVNDEFNARYSAITKEYMYLIERGSHSPFNDGLAYTVYEDLDINKLKEIASIFEGEFCFQNFTSKIEDEDDFVRKVYSISFVEKENNMLEIHFVGNGFMKYQVRMMVGNMLAYALGKLDKKEIVNRLYQPFRNITNYCIDACGLYLVDVTYSHNDYFKYNYHTHTTRCGHASGSEDQYVKHAIKNNFKYLGFSDHIFLKGFPQKGMRGDYCELDDYCDTINALKVKYKDKIEIHLGFEAEYLPEYVEEYKELLNSGKIEYLIMGQHMMIKDNKPYFYYGEERTIEDRITYCKHLIEGMKTGLFSYVAHPDVFMTSVHEYTPEIVKICKDICEASLKYDIPLELNLGCIAWRRVFEDNEIKPGITPYPNGLFWKIAGEYGVKVVMGVDAHAPEFFDLNYYELVKTFIKKYNLKFLDDFKINKSTRK